MMSVHFIDWIRGKASRMVDSSMKAFEIRPGSESSIAVRNSFEAKQGAPTSVAMQPPPHGRKIWSFLVQAAVFAVLLMSFAWAAWKGDSDGGDIGAWMMIIVLIPAAIVCEGLGLGKLSFFGPSTIPEPVLWCAMIFVAYVYCLVLVGIARAVVWSLKKLSQMLAARAPGK
jgi:hypothetical protein